MPTETLNPAEQAIADAHSARDEFLTQANDLFEAGHSQGVNRIAEELAPPRAQPPPAAPKPPEAPAPAPGAKTPSTIPGPPKAAPSPAQVPASEPAGSASQQAATSPDDLSDVPAADAFDKGPQRPKTEHWRKLHAAKDTISQQLQAARKEVETLKAQGAGAGRQDGVPSPELQKQLQELQQERDGLIQRLESVAVEKSPRFEAMFKPRQEAAIMQAKLAVGPDKAERVAALLQQPESAFRDQQIEALLEEIGPNSLRAQKLVGSVAELDRVTAERQALSQRGSEVFKQMQAEEAAHTRRQQEERNRIVQTTFDAVVDEWKDAKLDEDGLAVARDVFMGNRDLKDIARASMWVAYGPKAAATALKLQQENEALQAELNKLRSVQPGTSHDAGGRLPSEDDIPANTGYADAIAHAVRKAGLPLR